jgi:hypothetical protein
VSVVVVFLVLKSKNIKSYGIINYFHSDYIYVTIDLLRELRFSMFIWET